MLAECINYRKCSVGHAFQWETPVLVCLADSYGYKHKGMIAFFLSQNNSKAM
jgi:hypothetical protein